MGSVHHTEPRVLLFMRLPKPEAGSLSLTAGPQIRFA